ncbi:hypothetical protein V8C86DRAFT_2465513 [Haematococcus lacustris]
MQNSAANSSATGSLSKDIEGSHSSGSSSRSGGSGGSGTSTSCSRSGLEWRPHHKILSLAGSLQAGGVLHASGLLDISHVPSLPDPDAPPTPLPLCSIFTLPVRNWEGEGEDLVRSQLATAKQAGASNQSGNVRQTAALEAEGSAAQPRSHSLPPHQVLLQWAHVAQEAAKQLAQEPSRGLPTTANYSQLGAARETQATASAGNRAGQGPQSRLESTAWRHQVLQALDEMQLWAAEDGTAVDGSVAVDLALVTPSCKVAILRLGPRQHTRTSPYLALGSTLLTQRVLELDGWVVISVPWFEWRMHHGLEEQLAYLYGKVAAAGVKIL